MIMLGVGCRIRPTFGKPEPHNTKIFCYLSNSILLCYNMLMLTKEKGDIAVADAIHFFTINRYEVCLPIGDKRNYDLVVEKITNCRQCKLSTLVFTLVRRISAT